MRAVLCAYLLVIVGGLAWWRERGSPQSKPVGASHGATGVEG